MAKKKLFLVDVTRTSYSTKTFLVEAEDQQEAEDTALDQAGSYEFPEHDADYDTSDVTRVKRTEVDMNAVIDLTK